MIWRNYKEIKKKMKSVFNAFCGGVVQGLNSFNQEDKSGARIKKII